MGRQKGKKTHHEQLKNFLLSGFLIMCNRDREKNAVGEAYKILNEVVF